MTLGLLFPGQGAQMVGMGRDLAHDFTEARAVFAEADEVLGTGLSSLLWDGPEEELTLTRNAQPAILVHSVAVLRVVGPRLGPVTVAAGHSLGEFSAHVAAGTLSLADALRAVRLRGELMFEAGLQRPGTMAAVLGLGEETVREVCDTASRLGSVVVAANFNSEGQVVVSGDVDAVERVSPLLSQAGAKRVLPLRVSGAFHSPLMEPAKQGLSEALTGMDFTDPSFGVVSNVTAEVVREAGLARDLLVRQLTSPVRWSHSVTTMTSLGVDQFLELGPGSVLGGLNRRNAPGTTSRSIGTTDDVETFSTKEGGGE